MRCNPKYRVATCLPLSRAHLCRLDINLSYPQPEPIPPIILPDVDDTTDLQSLFKVLSTKAKKMSSNPRRPDRERHEWKRDLSGRANGTIDPWYGCDIWDEMIDYALNFTFPWSKCPICPPSDLTLTTKHAKAKVMTSM